jgi:hypothetical protein
LIVNTNEDFTIVTLKNASIDCGSDVTCCKNIEEIHSAFKKTNFDLVFIDCRQNVNNTNINNTNISSSSSNSNSSNATNKAKDNSYDYEIICQ